MKALLSNLPEGWRYMPVRSRFDASYTMEPNSGCWLWLGSVREKESGYLIAQISDKYKTIVAPRFSFEQFVGPIPEKAMICHHCDVSICVNPAHLYAGNAKTNNDDKKARGRIRCGERNHLSKLTDDEVRQIRADKRSSAGLGRIYRVGASTIKAIRRGATWRHVKDTA